MNKINKYLVRHGAEIANVTGSVGRKNEYRSRVAAPIAVIRGWTILLLFQEVSASFHYFFL